MPTFDDALAALDDRFAQLRDEHQVPGIAWGVVRDGHLVHAAGCGTKRDGLDRRPDADSVFRIASMTKSFTAATLLLLRDEGRLDLDAPVARYVPELEGWVPPAADTGPVTVRQLLTMSAGLPTDDPWGDRQQGLPLDRFAELLAVGPTFAAPPGTLFDYSNLGYGILGRVITSVAGAEYREVVRDRLLRPLGMTGTAYLAEEVPDDRLAHGYVRQDGVLVREGTDGYGALASMGGLFSSIHDLGTWVAGFLDAFPARSDPEGPHPLRRATRREMQQVQRMIAPELPAHGVADELSAAAGGYGFGLFVRVAPAVGTTISHSGGYPGFGSNMAWHPASGIGVIALANLRYAPVYKAVGMMLEALVLAEDASWRRPCVLPTVDAFRPVVEGLVARWDDAVADEAFAMNMDLDEPRELRRAAVEKAAAGLGPFERDSVRPIKSASAADCTWWLRGERGWLRLSILVTPEPRPRIQRLKVTAVGEPSPSLVEVAQRLLGLAAAGARFWPEDLATVSELDRDLVLRSLRAAEARFGAMTLGLPVDGDGLSSATWQLGTVRGTATLKVALDAAGVLEAVELVVPAAEVPLEAW
jgi:CubicO group peptidase (beta-lactamase class C family)